MPPQKKKNAERLAKSLSKDKTRAWIRRTREDSVRPKHGRNTGRTVADERELSPLARLMGAFQAEKIRFQLIGMSAAIVQGVPGSTFDVDLWIDLPARQYMRSLRIAQSQGAELVRNTVVALTDQTLVNFVYEVTGLGSFSSEFRKAKRLAFHSMKIHVLALESIKKSKLAIKRPKDLTHVRQIDEMLKLQKAGRKKL